MTIDTTYEPYSQDPGYISANKALMDTIDLSDVARVADLACGTGLLSQQLLKRKDTLAICGMDLDAAQIEIASRHFGDMGYPVGSIEDWRAAGAAGRAALHLRAQSVMELPFEDGEIDLVVQGNSIHLMPDKPLFLKEVARCTRPGARMLFNSVFYVGTFPEGAESVFSEWMKDAVLILMEMNAERAANGQPAIPRQRGKGTKAFSKGWLSADGWGDLLNDAGFDVENVNHRNVPISREGLALVGRYGGLAEVLMSGYPVEIASACLEQAAGRTFDRLGITEVPRNWLEVTAVRR